MALTGVAITARVEIKAGTLTVHLNLSPASLTLTEAQGGWAARVEELFVERNDLGREFAHLKQIAAIRIAQSGKQDYDRRGGVLQQSMHYVPGATRLFIVIRDTASGRTGSLTVPLNPM